MSRALLDVIKHFCRDIAPNNDAPPTFWARFLPFPLVFIPWLLLYEWVVYRGVQPGAFETFLPGEINWPIWPWMEVLYVSPYFLVPLAPLLAPTNRILRSFVVSAWIAAAIVFLVFLTVPAIAPFRPFPPHGLLGEMMMLDRFMDRNNGTASFPSFHVVWAFLGAAVFTQRFPQLRTICWVWATLVAASCVFTGMHSLVDILAGFGVFLLTYHYQTLWRKIVNPFQRVAIPSRKTTGER
jgi:membrane-associated phospholipid phosphatase